MTPMTLLFDAFTKMKNITFALADKDRRKTSADSVSSLFRELSDDIADAEEWWSGSCSKQL